MITRVYISDKQSIQVALSRDRCTAHDLLEAVAQFCSLQDQMCAIDATRLCALLMTPPYDVSSSETIVLHSQAPLSTLLPGQAFESRLYVLGIEAQQSRLRSRSLCRAPASAPASPRSDATAKQQERRLEESEPSFGWFNTDGPTSSMSGLSKRNGKASCDSLTSLSYSHDGNAALDMDTSSAPQAAVNNDKIIVTQKPLAAPPISYCSSSSDSDVVTPSSSATQSSIAPLNNPTPPQETAPTFFSDTQPLPLTQLQDNNENNMTQLEKEAEEAPAVNNDTSANAILDLPPAASASSSVDSSVSAPSTPLAAATAPPLSGVSGIAAAPISVSAPSQAPHQDSSSDSDSSSNSDDDEEEDSSINDDDDDSSSDSDSSATSSTTSGGRAQEKETAVTKTQNNSSMNNSKSQEDSSSDTSDSSSDDEDSAAAPVTPAVGQKRKQAPVNDAEALKALLFKPPPVKSPSHFLPSAMGTRSKSNAKKSGAAPAVLLPMKPPAKKPRAKKQS